MPLRLWGRNEENRAAICGFYRNDGRLCDCSGLLHFEVLMTTFLFYLGMAVIFVGCMWWQDIFGFTAWFLTEYVIERRAKER